ncbi:MAG: sulfite exporter TauE/SafE family protein [Rhodocyclaceae bacterium]|nr:sulfite exporter TauE/SafE family protein [Rhodocyclaceae bacterium]
MGSVHFAAAGIDTYFWLPPLAGGVLAFFCSMVGISGAFLLLPFQLSVLGFAGPAASATNLLYNLVSIPGALWRYWRENRLWWRLALIITAGGIPGTWLGAWLRSHHLAAREDFERFVALVLLYLGARMLSDILRPPAASPSPCEVPVLPARGPLLAASFVVGVIGTIYGIGGGSFMVPILVSYFRLPLHAIAGATLMATFLTSIAAVLGYLVLPTPAGIVAGPDWALGLLFGIGGLIGGHLGARCQRHVPQRLLKGLLALVLLALAARYVLT